MGENISLRALTAKLGKIDFAFGHIKESQGDIGVEYVNLRGMESNSVETFWE